MVNYQSQHPLSFFETPFDNEQHLDKKQSLGTTGRQTSLE
jgi:hypothetical protein